MCIRKVHDLYTYTWRLTLRSFSAKATKGRKEVWCWGRKSNEIYLFKYKFTNIICIYTNKFIAHTLTYKGIFVGMYVCMHAWK